MEIEPISAISGSGLPSALPNTHLPFSEAYNVPTPLDQAISAESETLEQRADDGSLIALEQLANDEKRMIPVDAQQLLPVQSHPSPAHEPGKGDLIDLYD